MAGSILVPLDGSPFGENALPIAFGIARATGARVHLVHVHQQPLAPLYPEGVIPYDQTWDSNAREQEEEYLRSLANRAMEQAGVVTRTELLEGPTVSALAAYAQETGIDFVVMTTHGRGGISRAWLGSVADALVRRSSVPVLLIRPRDRAGEGEWEPDTSHVLIPLDGSDLAEGILEPALTLGALNNARYTLLQVVSPVPPTSRPLTEEQEQTTLELERQQAVTYLEGVAGQLRDRGLLVETAVMTHTIAAVAILDYAAAHAVDLIALATHGRGGWSRVAVGSVAAVLAYVVGAWLQSMFGVS